MAWLQRFVEGLPTTWKKHLQLSVLFWWQLRGQGFRLKAKVETETDRNRQRQTETDIGTCIHMYTPRFPGNIDPILYHFVQVFSRAWGFRRGGLSSCFFWAEHCEPQKTCRQKVFCTACWVKLGGGFNKPRPWSLIVEPMCRVKSNWPLADAMVWRNDSCLFTRSWFNAKLWGLLALEHFILEWFMANCGTDRVIPEWIRHCWTAEKVMLQAAQGLHDEMKAGITSAHWHSLWTILESNWRLFGILISKLQKWRLQDGICAFFLTGDAFHSIVPESIGSRNGRPGVWVVFVR